MAKDKLIKDIEALEIRAFLIGVRWVFLHVINAPADSITIAKARAWWEGAA